MFPLASSWIRTPDFFPDFTWLALLSNRSMISSLYSSMNWALTLNSGTLVPFSLASSCLFWMPLKRCLMARGMIPTDRLPLAPPISKPVPMV